MNVRAFSDLADILITSAPDDKKSEEHKSEDGGDLESYGDDEYDDEFEDDFEQEDDDQKSESLDSLSGDHKAVVPPVANESVLVKSVNSIDISRSDDSGDYFKEETLSNDDENSNVSGSSTKSDKVVFLEGVDDNDVSEELKVESDDKEVVAVEGKMKTSGGVEVPTVVSGMHVSDDDAGITILPSNQNHHPVVLKHITSIKNEKKDTSHVVLAPIVEAETTPVSAVPKSNVRGPSGIDRQFSRVKKVSAWEVPGIKTNKKSVENILTKQNTTSTGLKRGKSDAHELQDRIKKEEIVMTVLDMLQSAAKKTQQQREVDYVTTSGSPPVVNNFKMGVSKRLAMQASGKFFMERVPDFDPDFDAALEFTGRASEDRAAGDKNTYMSDTVSGDARISGSSKDWGVMEHKDTTHVSPQQSKVQAQRSSPSAAPSSSTAPSRYPAYNTKSRSPNYTESGGKSSSTSPGVMSSSATSPTCSPNMQTKSVRQFRVSASEQWPKANRKNVLADLSSDDSASISTACESLYSSFLGDLINACKSRANECQNTEEMAMLKVLSEHVSSVFAGGERQEDLQCRMMQGAVEVHNATARKLKPI